MRSAMLKAALAAAALALARSRKAAANGGLILAADQPAGPYRVTVTGSPNPLRTGRNDISILVLQGVDQLVPDATVVIDAQPTRPGTAPAEYPATHANATNKQYYAANVLFPAAGRWTLTVRVAGPQGGGNVRVAADVSGSLLGMTPFELGCTSVPALAILAMLVAAGRRLVESRLVARRPAPPDGAERRRDSG
jgi:hypothetical protein